MIRLQSLFIVLVACGLTSSWAQQKQIVYLTQQQVAGDQASSACDSGFHMGSAFELVVSGGLLYDTTRGHTLADSGEGPPIFSSDEYGWFRTGLPANMFENCNAWTDGTSLAQGRAFSFDFSSGGRQFDTLIDLCSQTRRVWCVENVAVPPGQGGGPGN